MLPKARRDDVPVMWEWVLLLIVGLLYPKEVTLSHWVPSRSPALRTVSSCSLPVSPRFLALGSLYDKLN